MYHYLSASDTPNPFDDDYSRANLGKVPRMVSISREEMQRENVDPSDEVDWGKHMSSLRIRFLKELMDESEAEKRRKRDAQMVPPVSSSFSAAMYSGRQTSVSDQSIILTRCLVPRRHYERPTLADSRRR